MVIHCKLEVLLATSYGTQKIIHNAEKSKTKLQYKHNFSVVTIC